MSFTGPGNGIKMNGRLNVIKFHGLRFPNGESKEKAGNTVGGSIRLPCKLALRAATDKDEPQPTGPQPGKDDRKRYD